MSASRECSKKSKAAGLQRPQAFDTALLAIAQVLDRVARTSNPGILLHRLVHGEAAPGAGDVKLMPQNDSVAARTSSAKCAMISVGSIMSL